MQVRLAGFNVDISQLNKAGVQYGDLTPETISAAYARISRRPEPIPELRALAAKDVAAARNSNERIIFGLGHASIAEHAVFNFDIMGVSRLILEDLEARRIASFTEKSQRYVKIASDYLIPREFAGTTRENRFRTVADALFASYGELLKRISKYYVETNQAPDIKKARHMAKEDARYVLPLATLAQVGMTINARTLEYMVKALSASALKEARDLAKAVYEPAVRVAPSLVRYTEPSDYDTRIRNAGFPDLPVETMPGNNIRILSATQNGDLNIITALVQRYTGRPVMPESLKLLPKSTLVGFLKAILKDIQRFDPLPREFEHAVITFQAVISSSAFAQLKRHRMISLTAGPYSPDLGHTMPPVIQAAGAEDVFTKAIDLSTSAWREFQQTGRAADYVLTNAARRTVIGTMNLREAYHLARLRMDKYAQWDIRNFSFDLVDKIRGIYPLSSVLLTGKDGFDEKYNETFKK